MNSRRLGSYSFLRDDWLIQEGLPGFLHLRDFARAGAAQRAQFQRIIVGGRRGHSAAGFPPVPGRFQGWTIPGRPLRVKTGESIPLGRRLKVVGGLKAVARGEIIDLQRPPSPIQSP